MVYNPEFFRRMKDKVQEIAVSEGSFYFDQFGSPDVRPSYAAIGSEISEQIGGNFDAYCAAVGTGGSLMGAIDGFAASGMKPAVYAHSRCRALAGQLKCHSAVNLAPAD